jgi:hypothetical protein
MFLRQDLEELVMTERQPAVSIYLPTHVAGREIRQDPIRLRNLLALADERLAKRLRSTEREALLAPARALDADDFFWRRQEDGLGIFLAPEFSRIHKLPAAVPEQAIVGNRFHILPLLTMLDVGQFWLSAIKRRPAPVVIAAHPEIGGHFREIAGWKEIASDGVAENPDALAEAELHRRAWACVAPSVAAAHAAHAATLDRLNSLIGTGKAVTAVEDIIGAAREGRIDTLFVGHDAHIWGRLGEIGGPVAVHENAAEGDVDLLDHAALLTLRRGGGATVIERSALPSAGLAAALLRY